MNNTFQCPCGSQRSYVECCGPLVSGEQVAVTAEALMRSRFTAYQAGNVEYVRRSWHSSTCPLLLTLEEGVEWLSLEILNTQAGRDGDDMGVVEFVAHCLIAGKANSLHERSRFLREYGEWRYVDGVTSAASARQQPKVGRNDVCPCGSGKKYKRCCGR